MNPLKVEGNRIRLHELDLSTKHVVDDSREPEKEKAAQVRSSMMFGVIYNSVESG